MRLGLALACWASVALGQTSIYVSGPGAGGASLSQLRTPGTGLQTYFVDPAGSDANACTASGASACLTIQGAINKVPKLLRDQVTVSVVAGSYAGYIVSGFGSDNGVQQETGGLLIEGALATSTLATGSATGTATSGTAGTGSTFGTLTDSTATWTVNDLRGRFITTATPTNTAFPIASNTATTITIEGTWSAPTGSTTYTIQDPSVILTSAGPNQPATPIGASVANRATIQVFGNQLNYRANALVIRSMRITSTLGSGVEITDATALRLEQMQIRPTAATAEGIRVVTLTGAEDPLVTVSKTDLSLGSSVAGINTSSGSLTLSNVLLRNTTAGSAGVSMGGGTGNFARGVTFSGVEISGWVVGIRLANGQLTGTTAISSTRITCSSGAGTGLSVGSLTDRAAGAPAALGPIASTDIATCGTGVRVQGPGSVDVTGISGTVSTTGFSVITGGLLTFVSSGVTLTGGTDVSLDLGDVTSTYAGVAANTCTSVLGSSSRACAR
jgi:hypothetical protein